MRARARPITHYTTPTGSVPNAYNGYLRIRDPQRRGGSLPLFSLFLLQTTFECLFSYYNILYT